jgi:hypothetical protein
LVSSYFSKGLPTPTMVESLTIVLSVIRLLITSLVSSYFSKGLPTPTYGGEFDHCIVCHSASYYLFGILILFLRFTDTNLWWRVWPLYCLSFGFLLPHWYLHTFPKIYRHQLWWRVWPLYCLSFGFVLPLWYLHTFPKVYRHLPMVIRRRSAL